MAEYENGASTKELIIASAERLFYEKGYENTYIGDIASDSHVAKASILYHFKSKEGLYKHTSQKILSELFQKMADRLRLDKLELIIQSYVFWYKFYHDQHFRKYSMDCIGRMDVPPNATDRTYALLKQTYELEESYEVFLIRNRMILKFAWEMEDNLIQYYYHHLEEATFDQVAELDALIFSRMLGMPEEKIQTRIHDAKQILPSLDLEKMAEIFN